MYQGNIDLRGLRHVTMLAKHLSFTKAAEELGISQSSLSRSIQAIEAGAKVRLFDRDRGGVHLTPVGRRFSRKAAAVIAETEDLERILKQESSAKSGKISFGMAPLPAKAFMAPLLASTINTRPDLVCRVLVRSSDVLLKALLEEEIEFFICAEGGAPTSAAVNGEALGLFPTSLLARPGHPIFQDPTNRLTGRYPILVPGEVLDGRNPTAELAPFLGGPRHVVEDYGVLGQVTEQTDAIWVTSALATAEEIREGRLRTIPIEPDGEHREFRVMMYMRHNRTLSPAALWLRSECRRIIPSLR